MKTRNSLSVVTGHTSQMDLDGPLTTSGGVVDSQHLKNSTGPGRDTSENATENSSELSPENSTTFDPPKKEVLQRLLYPIGLAQLCTEDFESWCYKIITFFECHELDLLLKQRAVPKGWEFAAKIAKSILVDAIPFKLIPTISVLNTVYDIWTKINSYSNGSQRVRLVTKLQELLNMKFKGGNMETYIKLYASRVQSLINIGWKIEDDTIQVFLIDSIKEPSWGTFAQTLLHSHVKTFEEVCESLISESLRKGKVDQTSNQMAMNAKKEKQRILNRQNKIGKKKPKCSHCNKKGHIIDTCWLKHPEIKNKALISEATKEKTLAENINKMNFELYSLVSINHDSEKHCLNNQTQRLKVNNIYYKFYIDSGASCHMINDRRNLRDFKENPDIFAERNVVNTANGHKMLILGSGSLPIFLKDNLELIFLENVLYIPSLAENLISTSKLSEIGC